MSDKPPYVMDLERQRAFGRMGARKRWGRRIIRVDQLDPQTRALVVQLVDAAEAAADQAAAEAAAAAAMPAETATDQATDAAADR